MATAPFLGASIDQMGRRKGWLALAVFLDAAADVRTVVGQAGTAPGCRSSPFMLRTTIIALLFSYTEVIHNSLLVRAAGMGGAHKASSLALALGNAFGLVLFLFLAWGFMLPGRTDWAWVPKAPLFGLSKALHEPERLVGPMTAALLFRRHDPDPPVHPRRARARASRSRRRLRTARRRSGAWFARSPVFATRRSSWLRAASTSTA